MSFDPHYIDCVVLCGGNLTVKQGNKEKLQCMVSIERRPFLSYIVDQLSAFSFENVYFAVDYNSRDLRRYFENRYAFVNFKYSYEDSPLGIIGAAKRAIVDFGNKPNILIIKGNTYTNFDIFDIRNFYDFFENKNGICSLSYEDSSRLIRSKKDNVQLTGLKEYQTGIYFIKRKELLELPDICTLKDIEIKNHYILRMDKHKTIDINMTKNNHKNIKLFFRKVWGYDWSRYENNCLDKSVKECLYCNSSSRIKLGKSKYHGWKMQCLIKNKLVSRRATCEHFTPRGNPYCRIPPQTEEIT